jgi:hypothetical protein
MTEVVKRPNPQIIQGELTKASAAEKGHYFQLHKVRLAAGRPVVIELESTKFHPSVMLVSPDLKRPLGQNAGILPDFVDRARIDFTPKEETVFGIAVSSFNPGALGPYVLRIQEYEAK